jgi:hypothetical protein
MIAFASQPILNFSQTGDLIALGNDYYAVRVSPTEVLSVQPDGRYETRPQTAIGPWETAKLNGDKLVFNSDGHVYVIPMVTL